MVLLLHAARILRESLEGFRGVAVLEATAVGVGQPTIPNRGPSLISRAFNPMIFMPN